MKKKIIIVLVTIFLLITIIFCVNFLATNKNDKNIDIIKNAFIINNENIDEVTDIYIYYGDKTYYIINYLSDGVEHITVLDEKEKKYNDVIVNDLYKIDEKSDNFIIGYKYDKLVYEVKKDDKDGFNYIYYDAKTGELINKIEINK